MAALNLDKKKAVMAVVGAGVLGLAGWLAWDMFMSEPPPPPPPPVVIKPKPPAPKPPEPVVSDKSAGDPAKASEAAPTEKPAEKSVEKPATKTAKVPAPVAAEPAVKSTPAELGPRPLTVRSKLDARECLKLDTNQAIHRCAEAYR